MERRGFTLAELLIVLGVTGILAAVILPVINGLMPDKTKIMYLKVYDELSKSIGMLASDTSLYPACINSGSETIGCSEHPLINTSKPINKKFRSSNYEGDKKLCSLLAFTMNTDSNTCSDAVYDFAEGSFDNDFNSKKSFTTANGMEWWVVPQINTASLGTASYQTDIYVDVDSSKKSSNCIYNTSSCKAPDRFKFMVSADGRVIPADPMGLMYINTRKSYLKNKNQKTEGTVAVNLDAQLKTFQYQPCVETYNESSGSGDNGMGNQGSNNGNTSEAQEDNGTEPTSYACGDTYNGLIINCFITIEWDDRKGVHTFRFDYPPASSFTFFKRNCRYYWNTETGEEIRSEHHGGQWYTSEDEYVIQYWMDVKAGEAIVSESIDERTPWPGEPWVCRDNYTIPFQEQHSDNTYLYIEHSAVDRLR